MEPLRLYRFLFFQKRISKKVFPVVSVVSFLFFFYISSSFRKIYDNIFSFLLFVYQMLHLLPFLRKYSEFIVINAALIGINVALMGLMRRK